MPALLSCTLVTQEGSSRATPTGRGLIMVENAIHSCGNNQPNLDLQAMHGSPPRSYSTASPPHESAGSAARMDIFHSFYGVIHPITHTQGMTAFRVGVLQ